MTKLLPPTRYLILAACVIGLAACGKQDDRPVRDVKGQKADEALMRISPMLAWMELEITIGRQVSCFLGDTLAGKSAEGAKGASARNSDDMHDIASKAILKVQADNATICTLYRQVAEKAAPVFQRIKQTGELTPDLYVFSLFKKKEEGYSENVLGLFPSAESCEELEGFARNHDLATKRCRRWKAP